MSTVKIPIREIRVYVNTSPERVVGVYVDNALVTGFTPWGAFCMAWLFLKASVWARVAPRRNRHLDA